MVVRGEFMRQAFTDIGRVIDPGTKDYAIVIALDPEDGQTTYAIRNKTTFVDEYFTNSLPEILEMLEIQQAELDDASLVRAASLKLQ
jgi:hypothetical protein